MISYWRWFFHGSGDGPGIRRFLDWWLLVHFLVGGLSAFFLPITLEQAGTSLLLPLAGIFIGLSFAWGGNAQALIKSPEITLLTTFRKGGYEEYLYTYQSAVLLILVSLCLWAIAGLGVFDKVWPVSRTSIAYKFVAWVLFVFASMTLRECWHVVLGAQSMLLARFKIKENSDGGKNKG